MSNKKRGGNQAIRTTISLNPTVHAWALELARQEGHNSISDLIADLIRRKRDAGGVIYPAAREEIIMEDKPPKPPAPRKKKKRPSDPQEDDLN